MLMILVTVLHVLVCFFLVIVVLLQSGKAADLAGAFGGMGSQTAFGPRGAATLLSKATTVAAALFMVTSLSLSVMATRQGGTRGGGTSVLERQGVKPEAPAVPGQAPTIPAAQPSVTLTEEGSGKETTIPLDLNKLPVIPPQPQKGGTPQAPAQPPARQKQ